MDRFGLPPVDDAGLDEAGELVEVVAFTLEGEEALLVGEDVPLADDVTLVLALAVDVAVCAWLVQDGSGLGRTLFLAGSPVEVELGLGSGLGDLVGVDAEEPLTLGLAPSLGLLLGLLDGLGPVVLLLWLPLDDVTGAVAVVVGVLVALVLVTVCDGWVDDDVQAVGVVLAADAVPGREEGNVSSAAEGCGAGVWLCVALAPAEGLLLLLVKAWLMSWPTFENAVRAGGTSDRTTPMANTAAPKAKAGRSIASRQSRRGRCGCRPGADCWAGRRAADRWAAGRPAWPGTRRRAHPASPASKPKIASQTPSAPRGRA